MVEFEHDAIIQRLQAWGTHRDDVRAMILTSTRAIPGGHVDALSDYDVIFYVPDVHPWHADRSWLGDFGDVLVAYWDPIAINEVTGLPGTGNVTQYRDGLKIDFTICSVQELADIAADSSLPAEFDAGYEVLLDKDDRTSILRAPKYRAYIPEKPDAVAFETVVNDFFIGPSYVAKCLLRDEVLAAKWCLDYDMRYVYLLPVLEWWVQCRHEWSLPTGNLGKGIKRYLPQDLWAEFETTFAGAEVEGNWRALFAMMAFFGRIARNVAASLGFTYPEILDADVTDFVRRMRETGLPT